MATIASQIVLHPSVSQTLKFGSTTLGRDKTYRAVQYFARFLGWYLLSKGDKQYAARWNALKSHIGTARKLLRLGKPIEHLQAALRASLAPGPATEQITTIGRQVAYVGYLTYDVAVWANTIKFINLKPDVAKRVAKTSNRFWLVGILFSIVNGIFKSARLRKEARQLQAVDRWSERDVGEDVQRKARLNTIETAHGVTHKQLVIDILDVWIPATASGFTHVNEGALGIFGLITSLMGIEAQWKVVNSK